MSDIDFIQKYLPSFAELKPTAVEDTRDRLESFARTAWPELDTSPNTVLGDLILTPQAYIVAALEEGVNRFASDLDLGNVADDVIYNCDFVSEYIKNFAVTPPASFASSGVIRLTFSEPNAVEVDRSVQFKLKEYIYTMYLPNIGNFHILPPGHSLDEGVNGCVLTDTGSGAWFADIPVLGGTSNVDISAGTQATLSDAKLASKVMSGGAVALVDFQSGTDTASLPALAKRSRATAHSATLNTRNGAITYMNSVCPFVESVYAILSGDYEMTRGYYRPYGTATGAMDLYTRSTSYEFTEKQYVKLIRRSRTVDGEFQWYYSGELPLTGCPYHIESVTHPQFPSVPNIPDVTIISHVPEDLGASATYSPYETFTVEIADKWDEEAADPEAEDSLYKPAKNNNTGEEYTYFLFTYQTDPMQPALAQTAVNPDYAPINASILARGFIPVIISQFSIHYTKESGIRVDFATALERLRDYFGKLGAPNAYSDGVVSQIMTECGAKYMKGVDVTAHVQWSIGNKIAIGDNDPVDVTTHPAITSTGGLRVQYSEGGYAATIRNVRYYLMEDSISFKEEREM